MATPLLVLVSFRTHLSSATSRARTLLRGALWSQPASHSYAAVLTSSQSARSGQQSPSTWPALFSQGRPGKAAQEAGATQMVQILSLTTQHRDEGRWLLARQTHSSASSLKAVATRLPGSHPIPCFPRETGSTSKGLLKAGLGEAFKEDILWPDQFEHFQCERAQGTGVPTA